MTRDMQHLEDLPPPSNSAGSSARVEAIPTPKLIIALNHQIRTPLHVILNAADLAMAMTTAPELLEVLQQIDQSARQLNELLTTWLDAAVSDAPASESDVTSLGDSSDPRAYRILVCEDHDDAFFVLAKHLASAGYVVDRASDGKLAIEAAAKTSYNLILMDVGLPDMDGVEATKVIRDQERSNSRHNVPILALTAYALKDYRQRCLDAGFNGFLTKPILRNDLLQAVAGSIQ